MTASANPSSTLRLPPLRSRSWFITVAVTALGVVAIAGWVWVTDPANRVHLIFIPVMLFVIALGATRSSRLEPSTSSDPAALARRWLGVWDRRVPLAEGASVGLVGAGAMVSLVAKNAGATASTDVLVMSEYVTGCRDAFVLRTLADAVSAPGVAGGGKVAEVLRAQAAHLDDGGELEGSPLAALRGRSLFGLRV